MKKPALFWRVAVFSVAAWFLFALSIYTVSFGIKGGQLGLLHSIFISAIALASVQLPSVPGGWGIFEYDAVFAIACYSNISISVAFSIALMAHLCQYIPAVCASLISQSIIFFKKQDN